jgi:chorismate mutase/prephenate dehydratase
MTTHNRPGSLHELITSFSTHGVNMTRLESRPARTGQWEYYFYVDIEGHQQDPKVVKALAELRDKAPFLKVFGSYPAAVL